MDATEASANCKTVLDEIADAIICEREFLETVLVGILGQGHVLLEDAPGTGKTLTARSVATALGLSFSRIQFTPDLLPADITGTHVFDESQQSFTFNKGPLFANIILADEINRAPPKTQAALLEAMEEGQVSIGGETRQLPQPFVVIATQNPVEDNGTFPLPEAQIDRFLVKASIGYPDESGELKMIHRRNDRKRVSPSVDTVLDDKRVAALRQVPETIYVDNDLIEYVVTLARRTRTDNRVEVGVSPRGTQRLFEATRAHAILRGRDHAVPSDVKCVSQPVLTHRLILTPEATVNNVTKEQIIDSILDTVQVPILE
jgi:MoxR-like ATPase